MDVTQGVELLQKVPAGRSIPIHYDDYRVFRSPVSDFVDPGTRRGLMTQVSVPSRGDTVALS